MFKQTALLVVLLVVHVHSDSHWDQLIPQGKEVIYKYEALVKAGTQIPHRFFSTFKLFGKLHIQAKSSQELLVHLSDLTYTLHNGRDDEIVKTTTIPVPDSLQSLTKRFRIAFDQDGDFKELGIEKNEPVQVLNIKKAIAAILQVNWAKVQLDSEKKHSFGRPEAGLHGQEQSLYNVIPSGQTLRVEKMHFMRTAEHLYHNILTNLKLVDCEASFDDPISHDSQKVYIIEKDTGKNVLKQIVSTGGVYYHPHQAQSVAFYGYVKQTFDFISMENAQGNVELQSEEKHSTLENRLTEENTPFEIIPDKAVLVQKAKDMLERMIVFMRHHEIDMSIPDFEQGQLVNRIRTMLVHFDITMLENLNRLVQESATKHPRMPHVFQQMLSFVGTRPSIKFLIKLIEEKTMKDVVAVQLLQTLPFHVRFPSEKLITELEGMLNMQVSKSVQKAAVLSFSTLLQKLNTMREHVQDDKPIVQLIEKYVNLFMGKLKAAQNLEDQYLYFDALFNMKTRQLIPHMKPIVQGELMQDNNLRRKAMLTMYSVISDDPRTVYELFWPILTDRSLPTELRIGAYYVIMKSHPPISMMVNVAFALDNEHDMELYQFHYTFIKSLAKSDSPCLQKTKLRAKQLMKYMGVPPTHGLTHFGRVDVTDQKINSGDSLEWFLIDTEDALVMSATVGRTQNNLNMLPETYFLRIGGLKGKLLDNFKLNIKKQMKVFSLDNTLQNIIKHLKDIKGVSLEIVVMKQRQIVYTNLITKDNMQSEWDALVSYQKNFLEERINIEFEVLTRLYLPTEIGFPLVYENLMPIVHLTTLNNKMDNKDNVLTLNMDNKFKTMIYTVNGISIHNPIINAWQGVSKQTAFDSVTPINLDMSFNIPQALLKMSWKRHENPQNDVIALRTYATQFVFVYDYNENNILKKTNPELVDGNEPYYVVAAHDTRFRNNVTVLESDDYNIGYRRLVQIFDTENAETYDKTSPMFYGITPHPRFEHLLKQLRLEDDFLTSLVKYIRWETNLVMLPRTKGVKGIFMRMEPLKSNPVSSIDISARLDHQIVNEVPSLILPGMKATLKGTYVIKKDQKPIKTWDANLSWDLDNGHSLNSIKAQITRIIPGQPDYKICVDGSEKYTEKGLSGQMNILMSQAVDGKCSKDETSINLVLKGEQLLAQKELRNNYQSCHQKVFSDMEEMPSFNCMTDRGSIRKYEMDIKSSNVPNEFKRWMSSFVSFLKGKYHRNHEHITEQSQMGDQDVKIMLRYPIENDIMDFKIITKNDVNKFLGLPSKNFRRFGIFPDNLYFSNILRLTHKFGMEDTCTVSIDDILKTNGELVANILSDEWVLLIGNTLDNPERGLWVKKVDNKFALKIVSKVNILLVLPVGDKFTATLDGVSLSTPQIISNDWITVFNEDHLLIALAKTTGAQFIYDGHHLQVSIPKLDMDIVGKCL